MSRPPGGARRPPGPWARPRVVPRAATALLALCLAGVALTDDPGPAAAPARPPAAAVPAPVGLAVTGAPVTAGDDATVSVAGAPPRAAVTVVVAAGLGTVTATAVADARGTASVTLDGQATRWAGDLAVTARSGRRVGRGTVTVRPGPVAGPVTTVVGPRSIVADGTDLSAAVTIPVDDLGNALADGTAVSLVRQRPDGRTSRREVATSGLLAWADLPSGRVAGRGSVHAEVGDAGGPRTSLVEVAAPPGPYGLRRLDPLPVADGRTTFRVSTTELRDPFGAVQPDGTLVSFRVESPAGVSSLPALVVGGTAVATLQAPTTPGRLTVTATTRGRAAEPLVLDVAGAVLDVPVTARPGPSSVSLLVGPVRDAGGALVADGTPVTVEGRRSVGTPASARATAQLRDGTATLRLPRGEPGQGEAGGPGRLVVDVLGTEVDLPWP